MKTNPNELLLVYVPCSDEQEARTIAHDVVAQKLAACVHRFPVHSVYEWQGEICDVLEWVILIKTTGHHWQSIEKHISSKHSYDTPAVIAWSARANEKYLSWVWGQIQSDTFPQ